jgi:ATP-dependent DNA helicase RecG
VTTPAFTRLQRILDLEERQSYRNRSVIGGMRAMAARWADDARSEGVDPLRLAILTDLMQRFDAGPATERPAIAAELRAVLADDWQPPVPAPAPAMELRSVDPAYKDAAELTGFTGFTGQVEDKQVHVEETGASSDVPEKITIDQTPLEIPAGEDEPQLTSAADTTPEAADEQTEQAVPARVEVMPGLGKVYEATPEEDYGVPLVQPMERQRRPASNVKRSAKDLQSPITILTGIGPAAAETYARLGITKVIDLIWHLPTRYDDYSAMRTIDKLEPGEQVTVIANLWEVRERKISMNRTIVQGILSDSTGTLRATWYNRWIAKQLKPNTTMRFSGKIDLFRGQKTIENPVFEELDDERVATGRLSPVYSLTEGLSNNRVRNLIHDVLDDFVRFVNDPLPAHLRHMYSLVDLPAALYQVHFPDNAEQLAAARRRLAFEELFYIQLGVLQRRRALQEITAPAFYATTAQLAEYTSVLPFALTGAQERVIDEMIRDLERSLPMTRLVQGDVGSGKTAVAAAGMWVAALNGFQSAMLAPTQILAEQHHRGVSRLLGQLTRPDGTPVHVALLTGRVTGEAREEVLAALSEGTIDIVVGTTALIQETVEFANLGLAVVDEQHRFGVEQRGVLRNKGEGQPHLLVMSATPIPRSLALTVYGDLDISTINEMPPGRTPITTKLFEQADRQRLYSFIHREVDAGRQAYIVYPLVDESEVLDAGAAVAEHKRIQEEIFPDLHVALLHGRMTGSEKDAVMTAFAAGETHVLVSTTVIEVGIDVPNATVMVIEDADRFGLAQLHQLRGRVGRGEHPGYCALITKSATPATRERLLLLTDKEHGRDGFWIAQKDLELRGPGEFLGTRQSGLPGLKVAQLSDIPTLQQSREAAQLLFEQDPQLTSFPQLARQVERFWRGHGDVN